MSVGTEEIRPSIAMTERQLVVESVVLLQGSCSRLWRAVEADSCVSYEPTYDVRLGHLSKANVDGLLRLVVLFAERISRLKMFEQSVYSQSHFVMTQTTEALATFCTKVRNDFMLKLVEFQRSMTEAHQSSATLLDLCNYLKKYEMQMNCLMDVVDKAYDIPPQTKNPNAFSASRILSSSFKLLANLSMMGDQLDYIFARKLFAHVQEPYMAILSVWLEKGLIIDPFEEFFIFGISEKPIQDASVDSLWNQIFDMRADENDAATPFIPVFLENHAQKILLCGKSAYLSSILQSYHGSAFHHKISLPMSWKVEARESLQESNSVFTSDTSSFPSQPSSIASETHFSNSALSTEYENAPSFQNMSLKPGVHRPFLFSSGNMGFLASLGDPCPPPTTSQDKTFCEISGFEDGYGDAYLSVEPVTVLVDRTIILPLIGKFERSCTDVVRVLFENFKAMEHFENLKNYFFMGRGDIMTLYLDSIFLKTESQYLLQSPGELRALLHDSHQYTNGCPQQLRPIIDQYAQRDSELHILDHINFTYQAPAPLELFINKDALKAYSAVFSFLVRIKYAKFSLETMRCLRGSRSPHTDTYSIRIQILRMKILNFITNLHNHLMIRVLHTSWEEFQCALYEAANIDDMRRSHAEYLSKVQERCLISQSQAEIPKMISRILVLAVKLKKCLVAVPEKQVQNTADVILLSRKIESEVNRIEDEYSKCAKILLIILSTIRPGTHPHLEDLYARLDFNYFYASSIQKEDQFN